MRFHTPVFTKEAETEASNAGYICPMIWFIYSFRMSVHRVSVCDRSRAQDRVRLAPHRTYFYMKREAKR